MANAIFKGRLKLQLIESASHILPIVFMYVNVRIGNIGEKKVMMGALKVIKTLSSVSASDRKKKKVVVSSFRESFSLDILTIDNEAMDL